MHVHVQSTSGEAKFWIEPTIQLARNEGMSSRQIKAAQRLVEEHEYEIRKAWKTHFGS